MINLNFFRESFKNYTIYLVNIPHKNWLNNDEHQMLPTGTMVLELMAEQCKSKGVGAVIKEGKLTQMCFKIYILRFFYRGRGVF